MYKCPITVIAKQIESSNFKIPTEASNLSSREIRPELVLKNNKLELLRAATLQLL